MSTWEDCKVKGNMKGIPWTPALFLYIFITLFTVFCAASAESVASDSLTTRVSELPFLQKLANPCAPQTDESRIPFSLVTEEHRDGIMQTFFTMMKHNAMIVKNSAKNVLREITVNCSTFHLPDAAVIPSANDTLNKAPLDVLHMFYSSLLNLTARVYLTSEQLQQSSHDYQCESTEYSTRFMGLAVTMRSLICHLRIGTRAFLQGSDDSFLNSVSNLTILEERFTSLLTENSTHTCSIRVIRDCQVVGSTLTLLRELCNFLYNQVTINTVHC